jgi:carbonic anhydrase
VYGVDAWKNISKMCYGLRQSPINIKHGRARKKRNRSKISVQFTLENGQVYGDLKNNGHSPVFTVNASRASAQLTNVPNHRKDIYVLKKIYFRFGCTERAGSEHQFDGVPTPGEVCHNTYRKSSASSHTMILFVEIAIEIWSYIELLPSVHYHNRLMIIINND